MPDQPSTKTRQASPETTRAVATRPETWNEAEGSVEVVFSTGARALKRDWRTGYVYLEDLPLEGMDLSELNAGAHVLRAHETWGLESILGSVVPGTARIENGEAIARVKLSRTARDAETTDKIRQGLIRKWSYAYQRNGEPVISKDEATGHEVRTWASHTPYEISPVPVPADAGTGTRSRDTEDSSMADHEHEDGGARNGNQVDDEALRAAREEGAKAEAARQKDIRAIAQKLRLPDEDVRQFVDDPAVGVEAFRAKAIDLAAARADASPTHPQVDVTRDASETRARALEAAIEFRAGGLRELPEIGREYRGLTLLQLAAVCLEGQGQRTRGRDQHEIAQMALHSRGTRAGAHTTSDFPSLTANVMNKVLRAERPEKADYDWFRKIGTRNDFKDFKPRSAVQLSGLGVLPVVLAGAEYVSITMEEEGEQAVAIKFGAEFPLTMELLIDDDLGGLLRLVRAFGRSARITESAYAADLLLVPQTMRYDNVALFHASAHANLSTDTGLATPARLGELDTMLREQTDGNGETVGEGAQFLLAPPAKRTGIEQLYSPHYVPATPADAMTVDIPKENRLYVPRFAGSTLYILATGDPSAFEYGNLQGEGGAVVTSYPTEKSDSLIYHGRDIFGARVLDHRAFAKNVGA